MDCPDCGAPAVVTAVPDAIREYAPGPTVAVCSNCLAVRAVEAAGSDADVAASMDDGRDGGTTSAAGGDGGASGEDDAPASVADIGDALPSNREAALALLLAADRMGSLATNRPAVEALLTHAERAGVDATLALERLAGDGSLDPAVDLRRRVRQLEQLRG